MTNEVDKGFFRYFPKNYRKNLSDSFTTIALNGENTYYAFVDKKIILHKNKLNFAAFHEIGHAMNSNLSKIGKILQKSRILILLSAPILIIAMLKNKKSSEEKPKNKLDKATTFIKNNAGKLAFATYIPLLIEEGLASMKGNAFAKQLLSPELARKVAKFNGLGFLSYLLKAIFCGLGVYFGSKARDEVLKENYSAGNQNKN